MQVTSRQTQVGWQSELKHLSAGRQVSEFNQHIDQMTAQSEKTRPAFTADRYQQGNEILL